MNTNQTALNRAGLIYTPAGNDEESEISSSDDDDDDDLSSTTSWDDSLSEPSSNENYEDSSSSLSDDSNDGVEVLEADLIRHDAPETDVTFHEPSVPERPRILSSSSSNR